MSPHKVTETDRHARDGDGQKVKGSQRVEGRDPMETDSIFRRASVTNLPGDKDVLSATIVMSKTQTN